MNHFFVDKIDTLIKNITVNAGDPLTLVKKLMKNKKCKFQLLETKENIVLEIISNMKNSKTCGLDQIDSYCLKLVKNELTPVITHIINLSIKGKQFPKNWKNAKIIPLHKKDEKTNPKNYRPVALLPIFSKVLEKVVFLQIVEYLEKNDLFHPAHNGFRSSHNTCTALLKMYDTWVNAFENNEISAVVLLDMSAAFDVVSKDILLNKLKIYGFNDSSREWITSYLSNRYQQVYIDGYLSEPLALQAGAGAQFLAPFSTFSSLMISLKSFMTIQRKMKMKTLYVANAIIVEISAAMQMTQP